jgi:hypothetical protein
VLNSDFLNGPSIEINPQAEHIEVGEVRLKGKCRRSTRNRFVLHICTCVALCVSLSKQTKV